jgi:hypothetical protein
MKLFRILAIAALAMVSSASAQAGVVLSNISSLADISATNTNQNSGNRNAMGFTVGPSNMKLDKVTLALFQIAPPATVNTTVDLYSNDGGKPGTIIATSSITGVSDSNPAGGPKRAFDFAFSGVTLTAGTTYFVSPNLGGGSLSWYASDFGNPVAVGGSGFSFFGTARNTTASGGLWVAGGVGHSFELSASDPSAVPEPALTSLLCLGGVALIRRRLKK